MKRLLPLAFTLLCAALAAAADLPSPAASQPGGPGRRPHGPPPEAIAACKGQAEGATVSFTGRHGDTLTGVCHLFEGQLAARPERGPEERDGPPHPR